MWFWWGLIALWFASDYRWSVYVIPRDTPPVRVSPQFRFRFLARVYQRRFLEGDLRDKPDFRLIRGIPD